jgi:hypothetical protein
MLLAVVHALMQGVVGMALMLGLLADGREGDGKRDSGNQNFHVGLR